MSLCGICIASVLVLLICSPVGDAARSIAVSSACAFSINVVRVTISSAYMRSVMYLAILWVPLPMGKPVDWSVMAVRMM